VTRKRIRDCAAVTGLDGWAAAEMVRRGWWGAQLAPPFVEWMMGVAAGWVTGVPGLTRNDMLKILGNGVVPLQAAEGMRACLADIAAALGQAA
jgi:hypothetical protein